MRKTLLFLIAILVTSSWSAQCDGNRYQSFVFSDFTVTTDIEYGSNVDLNGAPETLLMDVYTPDGDIETSRPLIIVCHGGYFLGGDKAETDVVPLCEDFVKMGYVVASINYRVGVELLASLQTPYGQTVMRAVQDFRACVRWFRKNAAEGGNTYGINPNLIFAGGDSAGGFLVLHHAYLDESELPSWLTLDATGLTGGLEGESGNPGYSSEVTAIYSVAGALGEANWIDPTDDTPACLTHGDADGVVTIDSGTFVLFGIIDVTDIQGSNPIAAQMTSIGLEHCYEINEGGGHVPYLGNDAVYDSTLYMISHFFAQYICDTDYNCDYQNMVGISNPANDLTLALYPNPVNSGSSLTCSRTFENAEVTLSDGMGRQITRQTLRGNQIEIPMVAPGIYFVTIREDDELLIQKIMVE